MCNEGKNYLLHIYIEVYCDASSVGVDLLRLHRRFWMWLSEIILLLKDSIPLFGLCIKFVVSSMN